MAKSTGNNILPEEVFSGSNPILSKAYTPSVVRFFMLQAHYRSVLDFSDDALLASEKGFLKLMTAFALLKQLPTSLKSTGFDLMDWTTRGYQALNDDFNTPILIAELFSAVKYIHQVNEGIESISQTDKTDLESQMSFFILDILGLEPNTVELKNNPLKKVVQILIALRNEARLNKDFALSDKIRDQLLEAGVQLKDGKDGTDFTVV
jgi:cysteinyl-tRNA synthetase